MPESAPGQDIAAAFAELAETLASDLDIETYLAAVCRHCVGLVGVVCAVILYAEAPQANAVRVAWSDDLGRRLADVARDATTGPWQESLTTGQLITVADVGSDTRRWPDFAVVALGAGITSVTVIPVKPQSEVVGALALLGDAALDAAGIHLACSLADAAGAGIVLSDELRRQERAIAQLEAALTSRIVIEQAKGILAERWKVPPDEAFDRLRRHARATQRHLPDLAKAIIKGTTQASPDPVPRI
jgi:GAF domain-containing protein